MAAEGARLVRACSLAELEGKRALVRQVDGRTLLLLLDGGAVHALDNRCPHMGFPLSRGTVHDGILTCPWHHARFELRSGGTFDPFADDVRAYSAFVHDGDVWVDPRPHRDELAYQKERLRDGLEQSIDLVLAKACIGLLSAGAPSLELVRIAATFGATMRQSGWREGLTVLTAMSNILPQLAPDDRALALYHGMLYVAANVAGQAPHFNLDPLPSYDGDPPPRLRAWARRFTETRDRDGLERVVLTALEGDHDTRPVADMLLAAATDHHYLDDGHSIDFLNKAFELLDTIGAHHAPTILPSVLPALTAAARMEETSSWRDPVDFEALLEPIFEGLFAGTIIRDVDQRGSLTAIAFDDLIDTMLGDDPAAIAAALAAALTDGASLLSVARALCQAAALRIARFHTSNEFADWLSVLHTFTAANATRRLLERAPSLEGARSLWHTAMHLYLNRFLNAPAAPLPSAEAAAELSDDASVLLAELEGLTDRRQQVEHAALLSYRYLELGHDDEPLVQALARMLLHEDGEFHSYQMLEASLAHHQDMKASRPDAAPVALLALARYLAGHAPTDRATVQTFRIAQRLQRGDALAGG